MRTEGVELRHEGVEARLLAEAVGGGRACGLPLEGEMHALGAAVLLRLAGGDALDGDAEPEPPDREPWEAVEAAAGEGRAVSERIAAGRPRSSNRR
jgi:hypothetical protein